MHLPIPTEPANLAIGVSARSVADTLRERAGVWTTPVARAAWAIFVAHVNQFFDIPDFDFQ